MKLLIDTGAKQSFISPQAVHKFYSHVPLQYDPFIVTNIHASSQNDYSITIPSFQEFNDNNSPIKLFVYKFHDYFDGLIGTDLLEQWNAEISYGKKEFKTPFAVNPIRMFTSQNVNLYEAVIPANSSKLLRIPIDKKCGDVLINEQTACNCIIGDCISSANNNRCILEVTNPSARDVIFSLTEPVRAQVFNVDCARPCSSNLSARTAHVLSQLRTSHLNVEEKANLESLCKQYADVFYVENEPLTFTNKIKHDIKTKDEIPVHTKSYRYPYVHRDEVQKQVQKMLDQNIIRPSISAWNAPIWIVPKKQDASGKVKWRLVVDFRKLNEKTLDDKYPIPNISDILDKLGKCQYFTCLDLASGFYQIEMDPADIHKTAFSVDKGHYEFLRMPMGLKNSPSTFQRVMDNVLRGLNNCLVYLDDILVYSTSLQEHIDSLQKVFQRLRESNFKIQMDKSEFLKHETPYLGHVITREGIKPNPDKIAAIQNFPIPKTTKEIKSFLGLLGYYRKFIPDFARITKPMTSRLKKGVKITLTPEYIQCFEHCKTLLINDPILQYPDFSKEFILTTDASNVAIGAVLSQGTIGSDKPVAYASRTLNASEMNYSTIEKELLAIVWATKYFRCYLFGRKFKIVSDHRPLQWVMNMKDNGNSRLTRWRLKLAEFQFESIYKKGKLNSNADALSRVEIHNEETSSVVVNVSENSDQDIQDDGQTETRHTSAENPILEIPISEDPLNKFSRQLLLNIVDRRRHLPTKTAPFNNDAIIKVTIEINQANLEQEVIDAIKEYVDPRIKTGLLIQPQEKMYSVVPIIQNTFKNSSMKLFLVKSEIENVHGYLKQQDIIRRYHEGKTNHRGISETYLALSRKYFWPKLRESITKFINECSVCGRAKYDRNPVRPEFHVVPPPSKPFEIVHADVFTAEQEKYLTIIDSFSKFASAFHLPDCTAPNIVKALLTFSTHHGLPLTLVTDRGTEFTNQIVEEFLRLHKVNHHTTLAHAHNDNGMIERFHSTLLEHLRLLKIQYPNEHSKDLMKYALLAYNSSIHSLTRCKPFDLITGHYDPRDPLDLDMTEYLMQQYTDSHRDKMKIVYELVHDVSLAQRTAIMDNINRGREPEPELAPEQDVFVRNPVAERHKLAPRYTHDKVVADLPVHIYTKKKRGPVAKSRLKRPRKSPLLQVPENETETNPSCNVDHPDLNQPGPSRAGDPT